MANWYDFLKADPGKKFGLDNLSTVAKTLGAGLGAYGISSLVGNSNSLQKFLGVGGANNRPVGYQGGIPEYTATRTAVTPPAGDPNAPRRPGSGGRRYFSDVAFTPTGKSLGGARAPSSAGYMPEDELVALMTAVSGLSGATKPVGTPTPTAPTAPTTTTKLPTDQAGFAKTQKPLTLPSDINTPADLAAYAKRAMSNTPSEGRAIDSGEASTLLAGGQNLGLSPSELAAMLGVTPGEVVNRIKTDYPSLGANYLTGHGYAQGGLASLKQGMYLGGATDGMADELPATINGEQEAALSDGEFVIPADVVSHLGNGNSDAGAQVLYSMMDRVRKARTGTTQQGKRINPGKMLPK